MKRESGNVVHWRFRLTSVIKIILRRRRKFLSSLTQAFFQLSEPKNYPLAGGRFDHKALCKFNLKSDLHSGIPL